MSNNKQEEIWDDWEAACDANLEPVGLKEPIIEQKEKEIEEWNLANKFNKVEIINEKNTFTEYKPKLKLLTRAKPLETFTKPINNIDKEQLELKLLQKEEDYLKARQRIFKDL